MIGNDILDIQVTAERHNFNSVTTEFINKWKRILVDQIELQFFDYFQDQWCSESNGGWNDGFSIFPSTNNAPESTNNLIKREGTFRKTPSC